MTPTRTYHDFVLITDTSQWFHSATPIAWDKARDQLIAAGLIRAEDAGGYGKGRWMLSVDTHTIDLWRRSGATARDLP